MEKYYYKKTFAVSFVHVWYDHTYEISLSVCIVCLCMWSIIQIWSPHPLHCGNRVHHSRAPPSRQRYTFREFARMASNNEFMEPTDPLKEDPAVLALFDSLVDQDIRGELNSSLSTSASSLDLEPSSASSEISTSNFDSNSETDSESGMMVEQYPNLIDLPFYQCDHLDWNCDEDESSNDSNPSTPLSRSPPERAVSHESPWSDRELQEVDRELREVLGSSANGWETNSEDGVNSGHEVNDDEKVAQNCVSGQSSSCQCQRNSSSKKLRKKSQETEKRGERIQNDQGQSSPGPVGANGVGPSKRGKRKTPANSTATSNFEQYQREDFLKPKPPNSFYSHAANSDDSSKP